MFRVTFANKLAAPWLWNLKPTLIREFMLKLQAIENGNVNCKGLVHELKNEKESK